MANFNIDYLVVAGGGAGGGYYRGGGGGAGELKESASSIALSTGSSYDVVVGAGGAGVVVSSDNGSNGNNGDNSKFYNITSLGGGGGSPGDSSSGNTGSDGGSGGGAGGNWGGTSANGGFANGTGLGNNGGAGAVIQCGGGGGGANTVGFNAGTSGADGDGGAGKVYTAATSITGQPFAVAGGGGGANYGAGNITIGGVGGGAAGASGSSPYTSGPSGANNTGGGGGGGNGVSPQGAGGNGGSGIVILRYTTADIASYTATGLTPTEDTTTISGQTILSFTTVGTGTITFTAPAIPITPFDGTRATTPVTGFDKINTTQGLKLPSGDNSNQPAGALAEQGMIRNDTEETVDSSASALTHYNGTAWQYFAATESPDVVYPTSLKMYLDASNTTSYPGTGTTWFDLTSNGNNGAITSANFVNSSSPYYFNFGSGKYVTTTYSLPTSGGVSIELWFNANSGVSSYMAGNNNASNALRNGIIIGDLTGSFPNESITFYQSTGLSTGANYVIFAVEEGNTKYQDGAWHQLLLIDTGSGHEVYVDGASKTLTYEPTAGGPGTRINWTNFSLSKVNWTTGGYMNGSIGQCSIYEKALTQSEVLASFNSTRNTYGI